MLSYISLWYLSIAGSINFGTTLGEYLTCDEARSCAGAYLENNDRILCYGFRSCEEAEMVSEYGSQMVGSLSGYGASVELNYNDTRDSRFITARGYFDHSFGDDSSGVTDDTTVTCYGEKSCLATYFLGYGASGYNCWGKDSCAHSWIVLKNDTTDSSSFVNLYFGGQFSFFNGTLFSNTQNMNVSMQGGFSGYNGTIYCEEGAQCVINCHGNGCFNLNVYVDDGANCSIVGCDWNVTSGYGYGVACPNIWSSSITFEMEDTQLGSLVLNSFDGGADYNSLWSFVPESFEYYKNLLETNGNGRVSRYSASSGNNTLCGRTCDDYDTSCRYKNIELINNGSICCRAATSCKDGFNNLTADSSGSGNPFDGNVFCDGFQGCQQQIITASGNLYMGGTEASSSALYTDNNIYCGGANTCSGTSYWTYGANFLFCESHHGCRRRNVAGVSNIIAGGENSLTEENIYSSGDGEMLTIYLFGMTANSDADLYCYQNDTCYIYCGLSSDPNFCLNLFATLSCQGSTINGTDEVYSYTDGSGIKRYNNCYFIPIMVNGGETSVTMEPTTAAPTAAPTVPTAAPTIAPTAPTEAPTTEAPTQAPADSPTESPIDDSNDSSAGTTNGPLTIASCVAMLLVAVSFCLSE